MHEPVFHVQQGVGRKMDKYRWTKETQEVVRNYMRCIHHAESLEQAILMVDEMTRVWEINNATSHAVDNNSDVDRIHLIVDWVPNSTVRPEDKRPPIAMRKPPPGPSAIPGYKGRMVGRNEPCPCNSGKKFKHCHGKPN